eukprot:TRINITY_DN29980_c0_g1_i1.p1 TRINITY_DN29980_c0_g1~~TRINITY_DN29980_c0_g1_i1.p1  ORF type:complete len:305 (-),score=33.92 TRINITY_DN29980_c0_g1_i1:178-1092(-)
MHHLRFWSTLLFISGASTVRIRHLAVPDAVRSGTEVRLTCDYDLEGQTLQTVKWYKGSHEFYRYYPRNYPEPKKFFVLPKLYLNEYSCDAKSVVLRDVHADMSGYYTCEVTTQELYETVTKKHYLLVVQPPNVPPEITGVPLEIPIKEWLKIQCHLPWMNVKPELEFYVNGRRAKHMNDIQVQKILKENVKGRKRMRPFEYSLVSEDGTHTSPFDDDDGGTTTVLEFPVKKHHVRQGKIEVKCKATAASGLYESETIVNVPIMKDSYRFYESGAARNFPSFVPLDINILLQILIGLLRSAFRNF